MNTYIVQFGDLTEMIEELRADLPEPGSFAGLMVPLKENNVPYPPVIRVVAGDIVASTIDKFGIDNHCIAVHVRAINHTRNTILSCMIVTGYYQKHYGKPFGPEEERKRGDAWDKVRDWQEKIKAYIQQHLPFVEIRPGILDVGTLKFQPATWSGGVGEVEVPNG